MAWTKKLTQLNDVLGEIEPIQDSIIKYVRAAGLKPQMIRFQGTALDVWNSVISEADKNNKVIDLVSEVLKNHPENPYLISALDPYEINYSLSPDIDEVSNWESIETDTLEKLTKGKSTLLPISFLKKGIICSQSVAKVEINITGTIDVGTGFLFKIENQDDIFFMTNYHVINDEDQYNNAHIIFNYETDIYGNSKASKSYKIDKNGPWYKSPVKDLDVSVFKLDASDYEIEKIGFIELKEVDVKKNDFVNIIHHPGGQMKQISLYHNIVTNINDRVIQYLTDTLKGSSGAPVFNSNWNVVALHHSGGRKKENEPKLPEGFKSRNEGIQINRIIKFIKDNQFSV